MPARKRLSHPLGPRRRAGLSIGPPRGPWRTMLTCPLLQTSPPPGAPKCSGEAPALQPRVSVGYPLHNCCVEAAGRAAGRPHRRTEARGGSGCARGKLGRSATLPLVPQGTAGPRPAQGRTPHQRGPTTGGPTSPMPSPYVGPTCSQGNLIGAVLEAYGGRPLGGCTVA